MLMGAQEKVQEASSSLGVFSKLPAELRNHIFQDVFDRNVHLYYHAEVDISNALTVVEDDEYARLNRRNTKDYYALKNTSQQVRAEALPIFFFNADLHLSRETGPGFGRYAHTFYDVLSHVRKLRLRDNPGAGDDGSVELGPLRYIGEDGKECWNLAYPHESDPLCYDEDNYINGRYVELDLVGYGDRTKCKVTARLVLESLIYDNAYGDLEWVGARERVEAVLEGMDLSRGFTVAGVVKIFEVMEKMEWEVKEGGISLWDD